MKERVTIVTGEFGAFVADTSTGDLTFFRNGTVATEWEAVSAFRGVSEGDMTRFAFAKREPLRVEHEAFRDAVLGERFDVVTMEEGLRTLEVVEGVIRLGFDRRRRRVLASATRNEASRRCASRSPAASSRPSRRPPRTGSRRSPMRWPHGGDEVTVLTTTLPHAATPTSSRRRPRRRPCASGGRRCCATAPGRCAGTCST